MRDGRLPERHRAMRAAGHVASIERAAIRAARREQYEPLRPIPMVKLVGYITQRNVGART